MTSKINFERNLRMRISVDRKWKKEDYTIGRLFIDGKFFCNTLEDTDRNLHQSLDLNVIKSRKIPRQTAIPTGTYEITLDTTSPKFSKYDFYMKICDGKLPRLLDVPGFDGILIHVADGHKGANLVEGCLGVGYNKIKGGLINGKEVFEELYSRMKLAKDNEEEIIIEIY